MLGKSPPIPSLSKRGVQPTWQVVWVRLILVNDLLPRHSPQHVQLIHKLILNAAIMYYCLMSAGTFPQVRRLSASSQVVWFTLVSLTFHPIMPSCNFMDGVTPSHISYCNNLKC